MFENKKIYLDCVRNEVHYSRIIASYRNAGGYIDEIDNDDFVDWLNLLGIDNPYTISDIIELAANGKMELEQIADKFIKSRSSRES